MTIIDAHQHFWKYHPDSHSWIDDSMKIIQQNFLPDDLKPILQENNISGCIAIQAEQSEAENDFLISLAEENKFIKGIVGWVDLLADNIQERLEYYSQYSVIKGFRHILQTEEPEFMLQPIFLRGIKTLTAFNYVYEVLVFPNQLSAVFQLVKQNPNQLFVIDHLAKPNIKASIIDDWGKNITAIAQFENVYCKISGLVTEADYQNWKQKDFIPYLDVVTNAFGTNRIFFGSDWPVCLVAASYNKALNIIKDYFKPFSLQEQEKIFGLNAIKFYQLK